MKRIDSELGGGGGLSLPASDRGFMADMNGKMQVCGAITRSGARCSARAIEGSQWCYNHDPEGAQRRREAAQAGGRARWAGGITKEIERAKSKISNITEQVLVGELDPKRGAVAVQATQALLRALELEVKSRELDEIEARLRDFEKELLDERGRPKATESSRR